MTGTAAPGLQSFGAPFCEVKVDEQLGRVCATRWVALCLP